MSMLSKAVQTDRVSEKLVDQQNSVITRQWRDT